MKDKFTKKLLKLVEENPTLPVVPMVDSEICRDTDYCWWIGAIRGSEVTEYTIFKNRFFVKNDAETLNGLLTELQEENKKISDLTWTKAIIVYIGVPDFH